MNQEPNGKHPPTLYYFADPMCSWCWGFSPVIDAIIERYRDQLAVALVVGGLRPGTTEPLTPEARKEILHHWQDVHRMTGQEFSFEGALPEGFVYDTEPPSRAALTVGELQPDALMRCFHRLHEAFYVEQRDITRLPALVDLANEFGIDSTAFQQRFESDELREKTHRHFAFARRLNIGGFPTAVLVGVESTELLTNGYQSFQRLAPAIDSWLDQ